VNIDQAVNALASQLPPEGRRLLALLVIAGDANELRSTLAGATAATVAGIAQDFAVLRMLPIFDEFPALAARVDAIASAANDAQRSRGLAGLGAFDIGGLFGNVANTATGLIGAVSGLPIGNIVGQVTQLIGAFQDRELPAYDYAGSNAQQQATAAARALWASQGAQTATAPVQSSTGLTLNNPVVLVGLGLAALFLLRK